MIHLCNNEQYVPFQTFFKCYIQNKFKVFIKLILLCNIVLNAAVGH